MSTFTADTLTAALGQLQDRRARFASVEAEIRTVDAAIKDLQRLLAKLADSGDAPVPLRAVETDPRSRAPGPGTNQARILGLLRGHPRGLSTMVIAREANVPQGMVSPNLASLAAAGLIVKLGRGFWRLADDVQAAAATD